MSDPILIDTTPEPAPAEQPKITISRGEVQEWVNTLSDQQQAYLQWLMTRAAFRGEIGAIEQCATFAGLMSNKLKEDHKDGPARGAREVAGGLMRARLGRIEQGEREGLE